MRQGLKEQGYTESKNIVIEYRGAEAKLDLVGNLVVELVQLKVDVLVLPILPAILAAKKATKRSRDTDRPFLHLPLTTPVGSSTSRSNG
ncbi:MAG TPA: hypothetical protein VJS64_19730 [Pyrinomonadaceae bacterium]|nr:hypothetical protein [Pyrinomonadaceae bacterium]